AGVSTFLGSATGKIGVAALLVAGLSAGTYMAMRPHVAARSVSTTVAAPAPEVGAAPTTQQRIVDEAPALTTPSEAPAKGRLPVAGKPAQARRATSDLEGEVRLLESADADLRRGDAESAMARLNEHATRYPSGALVDEREAMRAIALCRTGRLAEGKAAADRYLSATRKSSLAARVRVACGIEKSGG